MPSIETSTEPKASAGFPCHRGVSIWLRLRQHPWLCLAGLLASWWVIPRLKYEAAIFWVHNCGQSMGWVERANDGLRLLDRLTLDKVWLADRLMAEEDGSLVCEGMILAYRIKHPDLRRLLTEHLRDSRWNWGLSLNSTVARQLLDHLDGNDKEVEEFVLRWIQDWP